jgi:serine protease Do
MDSYNNDPNQSDHVSPEEQNENRLNKIENEHTQLNDPNERSNEEQPAKRKRRNYLGMILSGAVGGVVAAIVVLLLVTSNIIPIASDEAEQNNEQTVTTNEEEPAETVSTIAAEEAEVSTDVSEVAEAVVGVVNMQQNSIWTESQEAGTGSGIIYKKEDGSAYVVTNQHVVEGAEEVEIVLNDEERYPATVLGSDNLNDLAVLQLDGEHIDTVASFTSSNDLQVGETVLAIGNPLGLEFANTVTRGIISGLDRSVQVDTNRDGVPDWVTEVIQTDAAINPGNSGGALVNTDGEVIGINSMKIAQGAVEGIGFAIPTDTAIPIIEQLEEEGEIVRPQIGVTITTLYQVPPQYRHEIILPDEVEGGVVIANVETGSPADEAGLEQFDVITSINNQPVTNMLELRQYLYSEASVGETVTVEVARDGSLMSTDLTLSARESSDQ